jgi:hypothetical protein
VEGRARLVQTGAELIVMLLPSSRTDWDRLHQEVESLTISSRWTADERQEAQLYAQMLIADAQRRVSDDLAQFSRLCKYLSDTRLFFDRYPPEESRDAKS